MLVAITNGDVSMVQKLDDPSFDFGSFSPNGHTFFEWAVRGNHIGIVKYIYARESNADPKHTFHLIEDKNQHGDSPLMVAVMNKHIEMAMFLIGTANARVRARENSGGTIFIAACASGSLEMVYYLFDQPVNYYSKNNDGQTALHRACYFGELAVVRFLLKNTKVPHLMPIEASITGEG
jgi:ankyrin repeat protein